MANRSVNYDKLARSAQARGLFGRRRRSQAVRRLIQLGTAEAVPILCQSLRDPDPDIAQRAREALVGLGEQSAVDAFCAEWVQGRDGQLADILVEAGHVASEPVEVRVLSALKAGQPGKVGSVSWKGLNAIAEALGDDDTDIAQRAEALLGRVRSREDRDRVCEYVTAHPDKPVREAALRFGWRHSDVAADCLFLFFTDQMDEYFAQDMDCQYLAELYRQADESLERRIRDQVRSKADQRLVRILRTGIDETDTARPAGATSDVDIAIVVAERNQNFAGMFDLLKRSRFQQIMRIIERLTKAGWEPDDEIDRAFHQELLGHHRPLAVLLNQDDSSIGAAGLQGLLTDQALADLSESELRQMAQSGPPPRRARALVALADRSAADLDPLVNEFSGSPDWSQRMAALLAAPVAGSEFAIETIEACLQDRVSQVGAAAVEVLLTGGLTGRTASDIERMQSLVTSIAANLHAQEGVKEEATRVLELMLCVLRHRIQDIQLAPDRGAEKRYRPDDIQILDSTNEEC